jgi:uncharacterized membrane protein
VETKDSEPTAGARSRFAWAGWTLTLVVALVLLWMAGARFHNVHQRTFDLGFYGRLAWGLAVFDGWDPIQHAHVLGLHVSPILIPLGWLGRLFGTIPVLLTAQVAAVAGAALVLGRLAARRLGPIGHLVGPIAFLAYPNLSHVTTYEFHPGTLAVLPLAWAMERLDAGDPRGVARAAIGLLLCREDLALVVLMLALVLGWPHRPWKSGARDPAEWRRALHLAVGALAYLALFVFVLHPIFAPTDGPFQAHFGHLGATPDEAMANLLGDPLRAFAHVDRDKLTWLPRVLAPLAFLPLLAPRLASPALPVLAIAFFSAFPTTVELYSHYLTLAIPSLVAAAIVGAAKVGAWLPERMNPLPTFALAAATMIGWALVGQSPTAKAFRPDRETVARRIILGSIPDGASVQAPGPFLPHLVERRRLHHGWKNDDGADFVVLDLWHRERYGGREVLLRTSEEPIMRGWLAKSDMAVVAHADRFVLLERGMDPRDRRSIVSDYLVETDAPLEGQRLTGCLRVVGAHRQSEPRVSIEMHAEGPCPADLALRIDGRVDLLFDGLLSPAHLRAGDRLRSEHRFTGEVLRLSMLRSSGARPQPDDPAEVFVTVDQSTSDP